MAIDGCDVTSIACLWWVLTGVNEASKLHQFTNLVGEWAILGCNRKRGIGDRNEVNHCTVPDARKRQVRQHENQSKSIVNAYNDIIEWRTFTGVKQPPPPPPTHTHVLRVEASHIHYARPTVRVSESLSRIYQACNGVSRFLCSGDKEVRIDASAER